MSIVSIVDYGTVNLGSIRNMLRKLNVPTRLITTSDEVDDATKILLPGVGAFDQGISALADMELIEPIRRKAVDEKIPILGVCLGMQLLGNGSEEGAKRGLGVVQGHCIRLRPPDNSALKVPHMGWNEPMLLRNVPLVADFPPRPRFYFAHSYHLVCERPSDVLATVGHGIDFTAMICAENVMGAQFHPEKSHRFGMRLLKNFSEL